MSDAVPDTFVFLRPRCIACGHHLIRAGRCPECGANTVSLRAPMTREAIAAYVRGIRFFMICSLALAVLLFAQLLVPALGVGVRPLAGGGVAMALGVAATAGFVLADLPGDRGWARMAVVMAVLSTLLTGLGSFAMDRYAGPDGLSFMCWAGGWCSANAYLAVLPMVVRTTADRLNNARLKTKADRAGMLSCSAAFLASAGCLTFYFAVVGILFGALLLGGVLWLAVGLFRELRVWDASLELGPMDQAASE